MLKTLFASIALSALLLNATLAHSGNAMASLQGRGEADRLLDRLRTEKDPRAAKALREKLIEAWLAEGPVSAQVLLKEAARAQADGLVETAQRLLDLAVRRWPDYAEARFRRAFLLWQRGRETQALAELDALLARQRMHFPALTLKVRILLSAERVKEAAAACEKVARTFPHWQEMKRRCQRLRWRLEQET